MWFVVPAAKVLVQGTREQGEARWSNEWDADFSYGSQLPKAHLWGKKQKQTKKTTLTLDTIFFPAVFSVISLQTNECRVTEPQIQSDKDATILSIRRNVLRFRGRALRNYVGDAVSQVYPLGNLRYRTEQQGQKRKQEAMRRKREGRPQSKTVVQQVNTPVSPDSSQVPRLVSAAVATRSFVF